MQHIECGTTQLTAYEFYETSALNTLKLGQCTQMTTDTALQGCDNLSCLVLGKPKTETDYTRLSALTSVTHAGINIPLVPDSWYSTTSNIYQQWFPNATTFEFSKDYTQIGLYYGHRI